MIEKLPEETSDEYKYRNEISRNVAAVSYLAGADTVSLLFSPHSMADDSLVC
jgi:hypothetical protein